MGVTVLRTAAELRSWLEPARRAGGRIGCVPTMGALHAGHGSLVTRARESCALVVATIFVNPMQFGPGEDLDAYPRRTKEDVETLDDLGCDALFLPEPGAMYPEGFATRVEQDGLVDVLCGRSRPGHFSGVLTVVLKLLNLVQPDEAFFGRKDYQQALVIRRMVRDLDVPVEIITCPIVREADGLAMSSRNAYLEPGERAQAPALRRALLAMDRAFRAGRTSAAELLEVGHGVIAEAPLLRVDYLEIRGPEDLVERTGTVSAGDLVAVAAFLGRARLIDNALLGIEEQGP